MPVDNPRVGLTHNVRCPHCREPHNFTEKTFDLNNYSVLIPLEVDPNQCTVQICGGCQEQVVFIGEQMVFPWSHLPDADLLYLPENLRFLALASYQFVDAAPARGAMGLRRVLEELCVASGWTPGVFATYVDFLDDTLSQSTDAYAHELRWCLTKHCKDGSAPIPTDSIRWEVDDTACVFNLMKLIDKAAWLLRATLPTTQSPTAFVSRAPAPKSDPA